MKVILDIHKPSCIHFGVQYCSAPEGFESMKAMHPEDEFIIADEDSLNKWDDLMEFLESMCWNINDYFVMQNIESELAALEEELEMEALYDEYMVEELAWYNHARMMGWE